MSFIKASNVLLEVLIIRNRFLSPSPLLHTLNYIRPCSSPSAATFIAFTTVYSLESRAVKREIPRALDNNQLHFPTAQQGRCQARSHPIKNTMFSMFKLHNFGGTKTSSSSIAKEIADTITRQGFTTDYQ